MKVHKTINESFDRRHERDQAMPIPHAEGRLAIKNVYYMSPIPPGIPQPPMPNYILKGLSFALQPAEILVIIGRSAAGKSTLVKLIVGV